MPLVEKPFCGHPRATLVQHTDELEPLEEGGKPEPIWFACWQCNDCGAILPKTVTKEDLDLASNVPWLDTDAYDAHTRESWEEELTMASLRFMNVAVASSFRNGNGYHNGRNGNR